MVQTSHTLVAGDGQQFMVTRYTPAQPEPDAPTFVIMPAMGVRASFYRVFAEALNRHGIVCITADLRGHGEWRLRPSRRVDFGWNTLLQQDWPVVLRFARETANGGPVVLVGHSLGGQLNCLALGRNAAIADAQVLIGSCSVWHKGYPRPMKLWLATQLLGLIARVIGYLPGHRLGFAGIEARTLMRDWARIARTGRYDLSGSDSDEPRLATVATPTLALSFTDDTYAPEKAVQNLLDKMPLAPRTHLHLAPSELDVKQVGHFAWVKLGDRLGPRILQWLKESGQAARA